MMQLVDFHFPLGGPEPDLKTRMYVTTALLCWFAFLRYDDLSHVMVHYDLLRLQPGVSVEMVLYKSKTDQAGEGKSAYAGRRLDRYCPVKHTQELLDAGGYVRVPKQEVVDGALVDAEELGPLLRRVVADGEGGQRLEQRTAPLGTPIPALSYGTFLSNLRRLFKEAGLSPDFGVHSLRAGGVTTAVNNGADRNVVRKLGRWKGPEVMERHYVKDSAEARGRVTALTLNADR